MKTALYALLLAAAPLPGCSSGEESAAPVPGGRSRCVPCCRGFSVRCPKTARRCGRGCRPRGRTGGYLLRKGCGAPAQRQHPLAPCERAGSRRGGGGVHEVVCRARSGRNAAGALSLPGGIRRGGQRLAGDGDGRSALPDDRQDLRIPGHVAGQTSGGNGRRASGRQREPQGVSDGDRRPLSEFGENGRPPRRERRRGSLCETEAVGAPDFPA